MLQWDKDRNGIICAASRLEYVIEKAKSGGFVLTYGVCPNYKHLQVDSVKEAKRMAELYEQIARR